MQLYWHRHGHAAPELGWLRQPCCVHAPHNSHTRGRAQCWWHSAGGTGLVALTVPQGGQVPLPVTSWRNKDLMLHHPKWYWALTCPSSGHCLTAFISLHFISLVLNSALLKLIKPPVTHTAYSSKSLQPKLFKPSTESSSPIKFAIGPKFVLLRVHFQIIVTTDFSENYF